MERFDESSLSSQLEALAGWKRVTFMLLCCARMVPNFDRFSKETGSGDGSVLRAAIGASWRWLETGRLPTDLEALRNACEGQAPHTEDFRSKFTSAALDAATAAASVLEALEKQPVAAALDVARLSRDTVDLYVQAARDLNPASPTFEADIVADPLMQLELRRQREDLEELTTEGENRSKAAMRLRARADQYDAGSLSG